MNVTKKQFHQRLKRMAIISVRGDRLPACRETGDIVRIFDRNEDRTRVAVPGYLSQADLSGRYISVMRDHQNDTCPPRKPA
jgi:hypothetical protein